jgi:hypothetical protein
VAVEARRGCGYRQVGGLYMVSGKLSAPCGRLPIELHVCPTCGGGIKQSRAWTWVRPEALIGDPNAICRFTRDTPDYCTRHRCPGMDVARLGARCGLLWVGEKFYKYPADFMVEAQMMGVSRRIAAVPRDFKVGETWVLVAHPRAITREPRTDEEAAEAIAAALLALPDGASLDIRTDKNFGVVRKGIVTMFMPTAIEKIVTQTQALDGAAMAELERRGITPVIVPDDDPDHNPDAPPRQKPMKFTGGTDHASP